MGYEGRSIQKSAFARGAIEKNLRNKKRVVSHNLHKSSPSDCFYYFVDKRCTLRYN